MSQTTCTRRPAARPQVELLEGRCLLAVGALDTTFAGDGLVNLQLVGQADTQFIQGVAVQADGKAVAAGHFQFNNLANGFDFAAARFNVNGSLDTTFGTGGKAFVTFNQAANNERANAVALQNDGKIVVAGWVTGNADTTDDFCVARLNADGSPDASFGGGGRVIVPCFGGGSNNERAFAVALQTVAGEQRIVLAGAADTTGSPDFAAVRLRPDGALDTSFNPAGPRPGTFVRALGGSEQARAVAVLADNSLVLGGSTDQGGGTALNFALVKLNDSAVAVTQRIFEFAAGAPDEIRGLAVQRVNNTDRVVAAGFTGATGNFAVARLNADLTDDTSFDGDGRQAVDFGGNDQANAVAIQGSSNSIVLAGFTSLGGSGGNPNNFAVARLTSAGALDTGFDTDGRRTIDFGGDDRASALAIDPRLFKILAAGSDQPSSPPGANPEFALARLIGVDPISTGGVFNPSNGQWFLNNRNAGGAPFASFSFGGANFQPLAGDWDGDGDFTVGAFDPATATFYIRNSNSPGAPDFPPVRFGNPGFTAVAGDWDGDGRWGIGVYDINTGNWYLRNSISAGAPDAGSFPYGGPGLVPVVGDWDGDGTTTVGVVRSSDATWFLNNFNRSGGPSITPFAFGAAGNQFVAGDWNGDLIYTPGTFNGNAQWGLRNNNTAGAANIIFAFGLGTFTPVAGDFDFPGAALRSAAGEGPGVGAIDAGDLRLTVGAALTRLAGAGADPGVLALLSAAAAEVRDLPADLLGHAFEGWGITLDPTAAGHGWFVDPTPLTDEEFDAAGRALPGGAAAGRMDLLTAVLHELGHLTGLNDGEGSGGLMDGLLPLGVRRAGGLDAISASAGLVSKHGV